MSNKLRWVVLFVLIVAGGYFGWGWYRERGTRASAFGYKVELREVRREQGWNVVDTYAYNGPDKAPDQVRLGDMIVYWPGGSRRQGYSGADHLATAVAPARAGVTELSVRQQVIHLAKKNAVTFRFQSVSPRSLPVTRRVGNASVTLVHADNVRYTEPARRFVKGWQESGVSLGDQCYRLVFRCLFPPGFFLGDQIPLDWWLVDDSGASYALTGSQSDSALLVGGDPSTRSSALVGKIPPGPPVPVEIINYYLTDRPINASRLTFEMHGWMPLGPQDVKWVTFEHVRVP